MDQYTIAVITAPTATVPGVIAVAGGLHRFGKASRPELRAVELRQAEWCHRPADGALERVSAALKAISGHFGPTPRDTDPREGDDTVRLVVADNFWASVRPACEQVGIRPDIITTIQPGLSEPSGYHHRVQVGRAYLLDSLRDRLPMLTIALPTKRLESNPQIITVGELQAALREVQSKPRTIDAETESPGLDRNDVLVLAVALAMDDLRQWPPQRSVPHYALGRPRVGATNLGPRDRRHRPTVPGWRY